MPIKRVKNIVIKKIIRMLLAIPVGNFFGFLVLFEINYVAGPKKTDAKATLLALEKVRFREELLILAERGYRILELEWRFQSFISQYYWPYDPGQNYCREAFFEDNEWLIIRKKTRKQIQKFVFWIKYFFGVSGVLGAAFHYRSDLDWGATLQKSNLKYIVLHRENMVVASRQLANERMLKLSRNVKFEGDLIIVHSELMKKLLVNSRFACKHQVMAIGSLRHYNMNEVIKCNDRSQLDKEIFVTLFSFPFSPDQSVCRNFEYGCDNSFEKLFMSVHGQIAELALCYPHLKFLIKSKWAGKWKEAFGVSLRLRNIEKNSVPNLTFTSEGDVYSLISKSQNIVALNSTAALEALAMGRHVIRPVYGLPQKSLENYVKFFEPGLFLYAHSEEELRSTIEGRMTEQKQKSPSSRFNSSSLFEKYVCQLDRDVVTEYVTAIDNSLRQAGADPVL